MKKAAIIFVVILLIIAMSLRAFRYYEARTNQQERVRLEKIYVEAVKGKNPEHQSGEEKVIGRISIPSLEINYIILNKTTDKNLDISITKVVGPTIHQKGNLVLAGHNMKNGSLFGRLKGIKNSDEIILEDKSGAKEKYYMIDKYTTDQTDLSPLSQTEQKDTLLTLITCTKNSDQRLIVIAKKQSEPSYKN